MASRRNLLWCWLFVAPNLILYAMFLGWPIVSSWFYSVQDWSGLSPGTFVGFANFKELLQDSYFIQAFRNTFVFMLGAVPLQLILGLLAALVLNNPLLRLRNLYRTLLFVPVITTTAIVGIIMVFIWSSDGAVDFVLQKLGLIHRPIDFLGDVHWALPTVIFIYVWKNMGINMIYWLAGLQSVPRELYEAARVDGAGTFHTLIRITLPLILPIGAVIALLDIAGALKVFDLIETMTGGGPFFATDVVSTYIYRYAFSSQMGLPRLGYAMSVGIFFGFTVILIMGISYVLNQKLLRSMKA